MSNKNYKWLATFLKNMALQCVAGYMAGLLCLDICTSHSVAREFAHTRGNITDSEALVSAVYLVILNNRKRNRRTCIRPYSNKRKTRPNLTKLLVLNNYLFKKLTSLSESDFEYFVQKVRPNKKIITIMKKAIPITT